MGRRGWVGASRLGVRVAALVAAVVATPESHAALPGYEVTLGVGETDNIFLQPTDRKSDTLLMQGLDFNWHEQQSRLTADIDADLDYLEYLNHTFNNQLVGSVLADARFALAPDLLYWDASDTFGQARVNPLEQITPLNQENINYVTTGPELRLPIGGDTLLDIRAHYARVTYQTSPLDSSRVGGQVGVLHQLSVNSNVSINVRDERVTYSNDVLNQDYSRQDAFAHFDAKGARTTLKAEVGVSKLRDPAAPSSGVMANLEASRKISASSTLALSFSHQYSDSANSFVVGQTLSGTGVVAPQTVTQQGAPFKSDMGEVGWNFQKRRTGLGLEVAYFKDTYQQPSTQDDNRTQVTGNVSRQITPVLSAVLQDRYLREKFTTMPGSFTENVAELRLLWRAGQRVTVTVDYSHNTRTSDLAATNYTDNRLWLTIGYGRPAQMPPGPQTPPLPSAARLY